MNKYYDIFRRNFPYVSREDKTINEILENKDNIVIEKRNEQDKLMGVSIINKNTILMLCVDEQYRNKGLGTILLNESEKIIKENGYDEMLFYFSKDKYANKSSKDLKEMIKTYEESQRELLEFDTEKRKKVSDARQKLFYIIEHLQIMKDNKDSLYTIDKAVEDIQYAFDELEFAEHKYDYSKLPKKN